MKAHLVRLMIIDFDGIGADGDGGVKGVLEDTRYPNRCIAPTVLNIETHDIGAWSDDHPLNQLDADVDAYLAELRPGPKPVAHVPGVGGETTPVYSLVGDDDAQAQKGPPDLRWQDGPLGDRSTCELYEGHVHYRLSVMLELGTPARVGLWVGAQTATKRGPRVEHSFTVDEVDGDPLVEAKSRAVSAVAMLRRFEDLIWLNPGR